MPLQSSGPIKMSEIKAFLGSTSNSLRAYSLQAGFTIPDSMSEFYGLATDEYGGVIPGSGGGGGGEGGGCLAYGTKVLMHDGSYKNVEDLIIGDIVKSIFISGLESASDKTWMDFLTNDFQYEESLSIIYNIKDDSYSQYYLINNRLKVTFEHPIFVKRNDAYLFVQAENLLVGDFVFNSNNQAHV